MEQSAVHIGTFTVRCPYRNIFPATQRVFSNSPCWKSLAVIYLCLRSLGKTFSWVSLLRPPDYSGMGELKRSPSRDWKISATSEERSKQQQCHQAATSLWKDASNIKVTLPLPLQPPRQCLAPTCVISNQHYRGCAISPVESSYGLAYP